MQHLERVREICADQTRIDDAELDSARQALLREIARAEWISTDQTPRRIRFRLGGLLLACAITGVAVAGATLVPTVLVQPASAAEVLRQAAETTRSADVFHPAPGEFIQVTETSEYTMPWDTTLPSVTSTQPLGNDFVVEGGRPPSYDSTVTVRRAITNWVPADRSDDWYQSWNEEAIESSGVGATLALQQWRERLGALSDGRAEAIPGGQLNNGDHKTPLSSPVNPNQQYYAQMPSDATQLLEWFDSFVPAESQPIPDLLSPIGVALAPENLRAAMLEAIALLPDATVVSVDDALTTIDVGGERVVVDTHRGLLVGRTLAAGPVASKITIEIVDAAPDS